MDRDELLELVPHYLALVVLVFVTLAAVDSAVGSVELWIEFVIVVVVAFAYRPLVSLLGIAPAAWK